MSTTDEMRQRVKRFAVRVLRFVKQLPRDPATSSVARQVGRSGSSVSANYHSAGRSRSRAEFIARLAIVVDEADETVNWFEILKDASLASDPELEWLITEGRELRAIFARAVKTARANQRR